MSKRARRGTGMVRQRPDGTWEARLTEAGKVTTFYAGTESAVVAKWEAAKNAVRLSASGSRTLGDWLAEWLQWKQTDVEAQTWFSYERHCKVHIIPVIGSVRLDRLTPVHMDALDAAVRLRAPKTGNHVRGTLSSALATAQRRGLVSVNVAKVVAGPKRARTTIEVLNREDVDALLAAARGDRFEALYVLAVTMGVRRGELFGLRWRHVDMIRGAIRIVKSAAPTLDGTYALKDPKTIAGSRLLSPCPQVVMQALARTERRGDYVWPDEDGGTLRPSHFYRTEWDRLRERSGIAPVRFHDLRHTAATHMLEDAVPAHVVAAILGHASVATTLRIYAHVTRPSLESAAAAINARHRPSLEVVSGSESGSNRES